MGVENWTIMRSEEQFMELFELLKVHSKMKRKFKQQKPSYHNDKRKSLIIHIHRTYESLFRVDLSSSDLSSPADGKDASK